MSAALSRVLPPSLMVFFHCYSSLYIGMNNDEKLQKKMISKHLISLMNSAWTLLQQCKLNWGKHWLNLLLQIARLLISLSSASQTRHCATLPDADRRYVQGDWLVSLEHNILPTIEWKDISPEEFADLVVHKKNSFLPVPSILAIIHILYFDRHSA